MTYAQNRVLLYTPLLFLLRLDVNTPHMTPYRAHAPLRGCFLSHSAGEIREEMPEKKVTLVTSKELMPSITPVFPDKFRARLCAKLEAINVTVHTDAGPVNFDKDAVDECGFIVGKRTYSWNGGEMESDLCVIATGWRHVPPLYADSKLDHWLDDRGILEVMQVEGPRITVCCC